MAVVFSFFSDACLRGDAAQESRLQPTFAAKVSASPESWINSTSAW